MVEKEITPTTMVSKLRDNDRRYIMVEFVVLSQVVLIYCLVRKDVDDLSRLRFWSSGSSFINVDYI